MTVVMAAVARIMAVVAAVLYRGVAARLLLADHWEAGRAAAGNINGTTWGLIAGGQDEAVSTVLVTIPVINPSLLVGTVASKGNASGIHKVINVNVSQVEPHGLADLLSLATRNLGVDKD